MKEPKRPVADDLEAFAAALASCGIPVQDVEVSMSLESWQRLGQRLDVENYEGPEDIGRVEVAGVRYLIRYGNGL